MSKLTDTLNAALAKKKGQSHVNGDNVQQVDKKVKKAPVPVITGKPVKKVTGRGG